VDQRPEFVLKHALQYISIGGLCLALEKGLHLRGNGIDEPMTIRMCSVCPATIVQAIESIARGSRLRQDQSCCHMQVSHPHLFAPSLGYSFDGGTLRFRIQLEAPSQHEIGWWIAVRRRTLWKYTQIASFISFRCGQVDRKEDD
jgi:hypothetical protein